MLKALKEARERLAKLGVQMRAITGKAVEEKRGMTDDENSQWDALNVDLEAQESLIKKLDRDASVQTEVASALEDFGFEIRDGKVVKIEGKGGKGGDGQHIEDRTVDPKKDYDQAFDRYMRRGENGLTADHRGLLLSAAGFAEARQQNVGTPADGGYLVPEEFSNVLEREMMEFGGLERLASVLNTTSGADLPWPNTNDTGQKGAIIGETVADTVNDIVFGSITLSAFTYTSLLIQVSWELLQDSAFPMGALIASIAAERIGRARATHFISGNGTTQPQGLVTGLTPSSTTALNYPDFDEVVDLKHAVDPAYRAKAGFLFHDTVLRQLKKVVDSNGVRLWQPAVAGDVPPTIDGETYTIDQDMSDGTVSSGVTMAYGDFSKYKIRKVRGDQLITMVEKYADQRMNGYFVFSRHDGRRIVPATSKAIQTIDRPA